MLSLILALTILVINTECLTIQQAQSQPLKGYVLTDNAGKVEGNSGVRIGLLDLKLENPTSIQKYGLPKELVQKLTPFLGVSGQNAQNLLQKSPLVLSPQENQILLAKAKQYWLNRMNEAPQNVKQLPEFQNVLNWINNGQFAEVLQATSEYRAKHPERI